MPVITIQIPASAGMTLDIWFWVSTSSE